MVVGSQKLLEFNGRDFISIAFVKYEGSVGKVEGDDQHNALVIYGPARTPAESKVCVPYQCLPSVGTWLVHRRSEVPWNR